MVRPVRKDRDTIKRKNTISMTIMLLDSVKAKAKLIGEGNISKGVAMAVMAFEIPSLYE